MQTENHSKTINQGDLPDLVVMDLCCQMNEYLTSLNELVNQGQAAMEANKILPDEFFQELQRTLSNLDHLWVFWKEEALLRGVKPSTIRATETGLNQIKLRLTQMGFQRDQRPN